MEIPYERLSEQVLRGIIEEFVLREGTEYGAREYSVDGKVERVLEQLRKKEVVITFDPKDESCSIRRR